MPSNMAMLMQLKVCMKILLCHTKLHSGSLLHLQKIGTRSLPPKPEANIQYGIAGDAKLPCSNAQHSAGPALEISTTLFNISLFDITQSILFGMMAQSSLAVSVCRLTS